MCKCVTLQEHAGSESRISQHPNNYWAGNTPADHPCVGSPLSTFALHTFENTCNNPYVVPSQHPLLHHCASNMSEPVDAAPSRLVARAATARKWTSTKITNFIGNAVNIAKGWLEKLSTFDCELILIIAQPVEAGSAEYDLKVLLSDNCHGLADDVDLGFLLPSIIPAPVDHT